MSSGGLTLAVPSKSTMASAGAAAFWLKVAPGVTTRGCGR